MPHEYIAPTRNEIAVGAYHVWERESRPLGRQKENWIEARTQFMLAHQRLEVNPSIGKCWEGWENVILSYSFFLSPGSSEVVGWLGVAV